MGKTEQQLYDEYDEKQWRDKNRKALELIFLKAETVLILEEWEKIENKISSP